MTNPAPTVSPADLDDLRERLARTRWVAGAAPTRGIEPDRVRRLANRWQTGFDWAALEQEQADLGAAVTTTADGRRLHYLHRRASEDAGRLPVLLLHGWPDTPVQFRHLIPLLLAAGHDIVAPTAAGFGYTDEPTGELSPALVAGDAAALMQELGYARYAVHGTDWGATVGAALAEAQPEAVAALHLLQPPFDRAFLVDRASASEAELAYLTHMDEWADNAAYVSAQGSQGDTLAIALEDSPAGLLAWIAEKYDAWSGPGVADDDILAAVATMWFTRTFRSSIRLYSEPDQDWGGAEDADWGAEAGDGDWGADAGESDWGSGRIEVPTAFAIFPQDIGTPPREFCERFFALERFTVMPRGGHWAALEEPQLVADDLLAFLADRA